MINQMLVKITARCTLNCDYCYVFNMGDDSWKNLPKLMSEEVMNATLEFIESNFSTETELNITFHGGEPLMYGPGPIKRFIELASLRSGMPQISYSLQTNMFGKNMIPWLKELNDLGVDISASTDGDRDAMDIHRKTHSGSSSFESVNENLIQASRDSILCGVISVIDPRTAVDNLFTYLSQFDVSFELLPIDTSWDVINSQQVIETAIWFSSAFLRWVSDYPSLDIRYFRHVIDRTRGLEVGTDAFGSGVLNLISIEPDGSIHGLDVLRGISQDLSNTNMNIFDNSISDVKESEHFKLHSKLLEEGNAPRSCAKCSHRVECHGGSVPHRWNGRGFDTKSAHCATLHALFTLSKSALNSDREFQFKTSLSEIFLENDLSSILTLSNQNVFVNQPDEYLGNLFSRNTTSLDNLDYLEMSFSSNSEKDTANIYDALMIINQWNPIFTTYLLLNQIRILTIEPISGPTNNLISLTDSKMKNTIMVNVTGLNKKPFKALDIAENIIHEIVHLILDSLFIDCGISNSKAFDLSVPWRDDLRDVSGVLHGTMVFWVLAEFRNFNEDIEQHREMVTMFEEGVRVLQDYESRLTEEGINVLRMMENGSYASFC